MLQSPVSQIDRGSKVKKKRDFKRNSYEVLFPKHLYKKFLTKKEESRTFIKTPALIFTGKL